MKKSIIILFSCLFLSGCSLIPKINFNTPSTVPQSTDQAKYKDICKGEAKFNEETGKIISCTKGYFSASETYNKEERKSTIKEKILNFFANLKGYFFWLVVVLIILSASGFGWVFSTLFEGLRGSGKALKALVVGIQNAKKYVRSNGTKYTTEEKAIYNKGASDMLDKIGEAISDVNVKKQINKIRAEL